MGVWIDHVSVENNNKSHQQCQRKIWRLFMVYNIVLIIFRLMSSRAESRIVSVSLNLRGKPKGRLMDGWVRKLRTGLDRGGGLAMEREQPKGKKKSD